MLQNNSRWQGFKTCHEHYADRPKLKELTILIQISLLKDTVFLQTGEITSV